MDIRSVFCFIFLAHVPFPAIGQNIDAGTVLDLGSQILRGLQQPQVTAPQNAPAKAQTQPQSALVHDPEQIRQIQVLLAQLGYNPGPADGLMGPGTEYAIRRFQAERGMVQDGQPSRAVLAELSAASGTQAGTLPAGQAVPRPSFDCGRAGNAVEFAICGSVILADKDRQLFEVYQQALGQSADPNRLRLEQRQWLMRRDRCGANEFCLAEEMDSRTAALRHIGSAPESQGLPAGTSRAADAAPVAGATTVPATDAPAQSASPVMRDDGILRHADGGLMVPGPLFSRGTPEFRQFRELGRYLLHAAAGSYPDELLPADNPSILAQRARDYLSLDEVRPYLCTTEEMTPNSPGCMSFSDASFAYSVGGGELDPPGDVKRDSAFLWWRGANEFERRRSVSEFVAPDGLRDRIIASAPRTPLRLVYSIESVVQPYDFGSSVFPVAPVGGMRDLDVPGSRSTALKLADVMEAIAVPPAAAEALRGKLSRRDNGDPIIYLGARVDVTPDQPHGGQPRWTAQTVSVGYFLDAQLTRPLETPAALSGQSQGPDAQSVAGPTQSGTPVPASVIREFQLNREDGRIVLDYTGYKSPTATTREAVLYFISSAAREVLKEAEASESRYNLAIIRAILNPETRDSYFGDGKGFAGQDEFAVQRNRQAFWSDIAPQLNEEAPALPIPARLYLVATLDEYDFDRQGFAVRTFQDPGFQLNGMYPFSLAPAFDLAPEFLPMPADAAERLVSARPSDLKLRLDFQVAATSLQGPQIALTVRPDGVALVSGTTVYFQEGAAQDPAADPSALDAAALAYLGPERGDLTVPDQPTGYPVMGVAPGMTLEAARAALAGNFTAAEIAVSNGILRAEHGLCRYADTGSDQIERELGTNCLLARVRDGRISRVVLRQVMVTGIASQVPDDWRKKYGAPAARGDGAAPGNAIGREFQDWGAPLDVPRAALGRAEVAMETHEAELDITYLSPRASVVVSRSDFGGGAQPASATTAPTEPALEQTPDAAAQTEPMASGAEELSVVGIRLGMPLAEAVAELADVGKVIYRATVEPAKPEFVQDRYSLFLIDNGESFVLHSSADDGAPVMAVVRRIPVDDGIPAATIRGAFVYAYGEPVVEGDDGGWTTWRWEKPENESDAAVACVEHFLDGSPSGTPPLLVDEEKDVEAILTTFEDAGLFASRQDQSFFGYYLMERIPRVALSMQDRIGDCGAFLNVRYMQSQTQKDAIWLHLVDPQAFVRELENTAKAEPKTFKPKL